jgi:hypothetical protein
MYLSFAQYRVLILLLLLHTSSSMFSQPLRLGTNFAMVHDLFVYSLLRSLNIGPVFRPQEFEKRGVSTGAYLRCTSQTSVKFCTFIEAVVQDLRMLFLRSKIGAWLEWIKLQRATA